MDVERALTVLADPEHPKRLEAVDRIYSQLEFDDEDALFAKKFLCEWNESKHAAGACAYIARAWESAEFIPLAVPFYSCHRRIAEFYDPGELQSELWTGTQFVMWEAKFYSTSRKKRGELVPKARYIAFDRECLSHLKYVLRVCLKIVDFLDVEREVAAAFLRRNVFSEDEVKLAWHAVSTYHDLDPRICFEVLMRAWPEGRLENEISVLHASNPLRAVRLRSQIEVYNAGGNYGYL